MAERWEKLNATIASGTTQAGNFTFSTPEGEVTEVKIRVPYGHAGLTGIAVVYANKQIIPKAGADWVTGNWTWHTFDLDGYPTGAGWSWVGFNDDDTFDHTFHFEFGIDEIVAVTGAPLPTVILLPFETA
jgi:hypothetical protein